MNLHEIEKLLEKYFNGETSLEEERELRKFFAGREVPRKWIHLAGFFNYLDEEKEVSLENPAFDARIRESLGESGIARLFDLRRPWIYWAAGVAASILILVAIFVKFDPFSGRIDDTYDNPEVAYVQAQKILLFVSDKMSKGTKDLKQIDKFNTGLKDVQTMAAFNNGLNDLNHVGDIDKVKQIISSN
jgi:hypothetical protein